MMLPDFSPFMKEALREAAKGFDKGEVPVGAVIVDPAGFIVARAHNQPISLNDPCAHAEILALRQAGIFYENYRIEGATLVVTIEPCLMCIGAAVHARVAKLVFGALDPKSGAVGSLYNVPEDLRLNHRIEVIPGVLAEECGKLMQDFFRMRRDKE
jgi:tRNA(adenine34) deaminase